MNRVWVSVTVGMQLFQQSRNFKLLMARLASFSLFMKRFLQNLPPYLSEILSAFGLKLPYKSAKMTILEGNFKPFALKILHR